MRLNIVFHDIVRDGIFLKNEFSITLDYFLSLVYEIENVILKKQSKFNKVCFYFDDGYESFKTNVFPLIKNNFNRYYLAIIVDNIDKEGYLKKKDLVFFRSKGICIVSHGCSHAALAVYKDNELQATPLGGSYKNSIKGKEQILTENQVLYQLIESKRVLTDIFKQDVDEFVFPYGLYNQDILEINSKNNTYLYMSTCDEFLDNNEQLRPRFLVNNKLSVKQTLKLILQLVTYK